MPQQPIMKKLFFATVIILSTLLLTGCIKNIVPLPEKESYQYIYQLEESLDLDSAGRVRTKTYDNGDGVFNIAYLTTTIIGPDAYTILRERLNKLGGEGCQEGTNETSIVCIIGQVHVEMKRTSTDAPSVFIRIEDPYNGRNQYEEK